MPTGHPLGHDELLTLARRLAAAADDGDAARTGAAALRLLAALRSHLADERAALLRVPPAEARLLARGQGRLLGLLVDVALNADRGRPDGTCGCARLAAEFLARLSLQVGDERRDLRAAAGPTS